MSALPATGELRQRQQPYRSEQYRRHVASKPCLACGWAQPRESGAICQAAHIRTGFHGIGCKPDDWYVIPLCAENGWSCHVEFGKGEEAFAREHLKMSIDELKRRAKANWLQWERNQ